MNRFKVIGAALILSSVIDIGVALTVLPPNLQWLLFLAAATTAALGGYFFFRGLNQDNT